MKNLAACHFMGDVFEYITWEYYQVAEGDRILYRSFFQIIMVMRFGAGFFLPLNKMFLSFHIKSSGYSLEIILTYLNLIIHTFQRCVSKIICNKYRIVSTIPINKTNYFSVGRNINFLLLVRFPTLLIIFVIMSHPVLYEKISCMKE